VKISYLAFEELDTSMIHLFFTWHYANFAKVCPFQSEDNKSLPLHIFIF